MLTYGPAPGKTVEETETTLKAKVFAFLQGDPFISLILILGVTVGFFHGWLKIHFPHPAVTFLFDGLLLLALALTYLRQERKTPFIPHSGIGNALKAFYVVCGLYLLLPWGPSWVVSIAAVRGWCFPALMFCLGYHLTQKLPQVKAYFYVLILLGLITSTYGIQQGLSEVEGQMLQDKNFAERYKFTFYATDEGDRQLRVFSTFVSSGAFGGTLAYIILFGVILLADSQANKRERIALALCLLPMSYALLLSGARSSLIMIGAGFLFIAWYRRKLKLFLLAPILYASFFLAAKYTEGAALQRYGTLLDWEEVGQRLMIPTRIGWEYLIENPIGGGLGRSSYSLPFFLLRESNAEEFVVADGDLGRLMIEMGIPGLVFFGMILWRTCLMLKQNLNKFQDSPASTVALASGVCIVLAVVAFPIGSPFLGIPLGAMSWFFIGTLQRLSEEHDRGRWEPAQKTSSAQENGKRFFYYKPPKPNRKGASRK